MAYTVKAKDGTLITDIPDDVPKDDPRVKARYEQIKSTGKPSGAFSEVAASASPQVAAPIPGAPVASAQGTAPTAPPPPQSLGQDMMQGLKQGTAATVRGLATGAANAVGTVVDPAVVTINAILDAVGAPPEIRGATLGQATKNLLDLIGVPQSETMAAKIVESASRGLGGAATGIGVGGAIAGAPALGSSMAGAVGKSMASGPMQQALGGIGSEVASEVAAQQGASPGVQMAAGLAGGLAGGTVGGIKKRPNISMQAEELMQKAAKGSGAAQKALAEVADINPESVASAKRLGINLPTDVFSDNPQIRAAAGLGRSVAGSKAESQWRDTVKSAVERADQIMQEAGATFSDGSAAPAVTSARVKDSLMSARKELKDKAVKIYTEIDDSVPKSTPATFNKTKQTLSEIAEEVGKDGMSAQEKKLLDMASDSNTTYGRLIREKNLMGQAIAKKDSPYGNMEAGALKRLYGALAEDQLDTVGAIGSPELKEQLISANLMYGKEREIGKQIVNAFGKDQAGSIADKMRLAITSASKGDTGAYTRLLDTVPDELKKDVVATSLASVARSGRGAEAGGFGFSEFAKTYKGIRGNPEVYKSIVENLGPESDKLLRDLYEVSRKVTDARANVLQTGKANQAYLQGMVSENFLQKLLGTPLGKNITMLAGTAAGAATAGPFGAAAGSGLSSSFLESIVQSDKKTATMIGDLFLNPKFQGLMTKLSTGANISSNEVQDLANSQAFNKFAKESGIEASNKAAWLMSIIRGSQPKSEEQ
jgi:hypothetical protein